MMKEVENHCEGIPFDVSEAAAAATVDLLPCKSKERYERAFQIFEDWRQEKKLLHLPKKYFLRILRKKQVWRNPQVFGAFILC
jgi:hypothetical protein